MYNRSFWTFLKENPVKIPIMQRDYAQGRKSEKINQIRRNFLVAILNALKNKQSLTLDFVYGYKKNNDFYPLDGQQRLTTLYLLHWYVAAREGRLGDEDKKILKGFSYEIRHSSHVFCEKLSGYSPDCFDGDLDKHIVNEDWFMQSWKYDATISSMLEVLKEINELYKEMAICGEWEQLTVREGCLINFHYLPMDDYGLSDELYIKMNSRGKELTDFEVFKAGLSEKLTEKENKTFLSKIDGVWTDLFWDLYKDGDGDIAQKVDSAFMRFFDYAELITGKDDYTRLFSWLDIFVELTNNNSTFFKDNFYYGEAFEENKVRLFFDDKEVNLFKACADNFHKGDKAKNNFSIWQQLMLYGCILHLEHKTDGKDFKKRIRQLRNLVANSSDSLREDALPDLLKETEKVIVEGDISSVQVFNSRQADEENDKDKYVDREALYSTICQLEDHKLLRGCLALIYPIDVEKLHVRAAAFLRLFVKNCNYDLISRALLTCGDYSQQEDRNERYRFGNEYESTWRELFKPSKNRKGYKDKLQPTMSKLLDSLAPQEDVEQQLKKMVECKIVDSIARGSYDWQYYFLKYDDFRPIEYVSGYYDWPNKKYEVTKFNKIRTNGHHWDPFLLAVNRDIGKKGAIGPYKAPLIIRGVRIENKNEGFIFSGDEAILDNAVSEKLLNKTAEGYSLPVEQVNGIDIYDRIQKCADVLEKIFGEE